MKKTYSDANLQNMYDRPKWYLFIPLIGFGIYMRNVVVYGREAGLFDKSTPGGAYMAKLTNNFFVIFNIFTPIWTLFAALMFNFPFFFWRIKTRQAMKMNRGIY